MQIPQTVRKLRLLLLVFLLFCYCMGYGIYGQSTKIKYTKINYYILIFVNESDSIIF